MAVKPYSAADLDDMVRRQLQPAFQAIVQFARNTKKEDITFIYESDVPENVIVTLEQKVLALGFSSVRIERPLNSLVVRMTGNPFILIETNERAALYVRAISTILRKQDSVEWQLYKVDWSDVKISMDYPQLPTNAHEAVRRLFIAEGWDDVTFGHGRVTLWR